MLSFLRQKTRKKVVYSLNNLILKLTHLLSSTFINCALISVIIYVLCPQGKRVLSHDTTRCAFFITLAACRYFMSCL